MNSSGARQRGATLLVALVMLLLITLLAASSMRQTALQARSGGNVAEQNRAFNAAEAALREGERRLLALRNKAAFTAASAGFGSCPDSVAAIGGNLCILTRSDDLATLALTQAWAVDALQAKGVAARSLAYTGSDGNSSFTLPPRWVVTQINDNLANPDLSLTGQGKGSAFYRVTAAAQFGAGRFPVILQSVVAVDVQ